MSATDPTSLGLTAERLEDTWQQGRRTDARIVADWLTEQGVHPRLVARDAKTWDPFDWRVIEDETGIPCPETVQRIVIEMLRGAER